MVIGDFQTDAKWVVNLLYRSLNEKSIYFMYRKIWLQNLFKIKSYGNGIIELDQVKNGIERKKKHSAKQYCLYGQPICNITEGANKTQEEISRKAEQ